jgi:peptide/nickel transport system substrate-binding protein
MGSGGLTTVGSNGMTYVTSRRRILLVTASSVAAAALAGCGKSSGTGSAPAAGSGGSAEKGSRTHPSPAPGTLHESPLLHDQVAAGKLPKLAERIPTEPYVVPHTWLRPGTYGGLMRMGLTNTADSSVYELCYGHSIVRYVNDGTDIVAGLAKSWETNADASVWTFHFREGLRWSDGQPWSTADIMYWWTDMVIDPNHPASPPDDVRSGKDTVAKVTAPDANTLVLTFDAPAPVTLERLAAWVNGPVGPRWMAPKHYISAFHPRYNHKIDPKSDWSTAHDAKLLWAANPACPTMTGWRGQAYREGRSITVERNPYYWAVSPDGDQLPYLDSVTWLCTQDPQVQKLQFLTGKADFVQGNHSSLTLSDVSELKKAEAKGVVHIELWDSGSGTGAMSFFNLDTPNVRLRKLFAEQDFRLAMSQAINRTVAQKAIYFEQGEPTTGTISPKNAAFQFDAGTAKQGLALYRDWRDSAVTYDPAKAKSLLDKLGVVDADGDGFREYPDGTKLKLRLDYPADVTAEHIAMAAQVKRDWEAVGVQTMINPVSPAGYFQQWGRGELMVNHAWVEGTNHPLIDPPMVLPISVDMYAPLHGQGYVLQTSAPDTLTAQRGVDPWKRKPPFLTPADKMPLAATFATMYDLFAQARVTPDPVKRMSLLWQILKLHVEKGPFFYGVVANAPTVVVRHPELGNVPTHDNLALGGFTQPWVIPAPAVYDPETFFWPDPTKHHL